MDFSGYILKLTASTLYYKRLQLKESEGMILCRRMEKVWKFV